MPPLPIPMRQKRAEGQRNESGICNQRNHCGIAPALSDVRAAQTGKVLNLGGLAGKRDDTQRILTTGGLLFGLIGSDQTAWDFHGEDFLRRENFPKPCAWSNRAPGLSRMPG